jgi:YHS domain-containing protein
MKTILLRLALAVFAFLPLAARAEKPVNATLFGVAIKGYDPVAYFTEAKPVKGNSDFAFEWMGAKWHFANAANRDSFKAAPEKYAPQFGGFCAWAVSQGYTAGIDPAAWKIVNGKLYLNYNSEIQKKWEGDASGNIAKADVNWPKLLKK